MIRTGIVKDPAKTLPDRGERKKLTLNKTDIAAVFLIAGALLYHFFFISRGVGYTDESFYYTIVQRLLHGDRLFADEWYVTQLCAVLQIIPYKIAYRICGSAEGILLCLRYLYFACRVPLSVWLYTKVRRYGVWGLLGVLTYLLFMDFDAATFSYYTAFLDGLVVVGAVLFLSDKLTPHRLFFAGFVFACVVLAEPFAVFIYMVYSIATAWNALRKRRGKKTAGSRISLLEPKRWAFISVGIAACAILFAVFFFCNSSLVPALRALPEIFSSSGYEILHGTPSFIKKLLGIKTALGRVFFPFVILLFSAIWLNKTQKKNNTLKFLLFITGCIGLSYCLLRLIVRFRFEKQISWYFFAPLQFFAVFFRLLCDKKDPKATGLLAAGLLFSVCRDFSSQVMIGLGGVLSQFCMWICAGALLRELLTALRAEPGWHKAMRGRLKACICTELAALICIFAWTASFILTQMFCPLSETDEPGADMIVLHSVIEAGPQKGIRTTPEVNDAIQKMISDIDAADIAPDEKLYALGGAACLYLYADRTYSCCSAWFENSFEKQKRYWQLYPERTPDVIYIPYYDFTRYRLTAEAVTNQYFSVLDELFVYEKTEGAGGCILKVTGVRN